MDRVGWKALFDDWSWVRGEGRYPVAAYSEYMPPPRVGQKPYGNWDLQLPFTADDPYGWRIEAVAQERELRAGLENIARQLMESIVALATGQGAHRIGRYHLEGNPYWPQSLAVQSSTLKHERYVFLSPLALSQTQDDKGRVRWTLFGGSHNGPAKGFWMSFYSAPDEEWPVARSLDAIRTILRDVYSESDPDLADLYTAGFRVLPTGALSEFPGLADGTLPAWTLRFVFGEHEQVGAVRYLLTFRPFGLLPKAVQEAYLNGQLNLLPSPASLVFWGSPLYRKLEATLPLAQHLLLLQTISRHDAPHGIRVPQSGWLHHPSQVHDPELGEARTTFRRSHRWERVHRDDDAKAFAREDHLHKVLFSTDPDDVGLYGKPMARNVQLWSRDFRAVLNGPNADGEDIAHAIVAMEDRQSFGYRFYYPPMRAGRFEVFWHLPLVAFRDPESGRAHIIDTALHGYLGAMDVVSPLAGEIELWPRLPASAPRLPPGHASEAERSRRAAEAFAEHLQVSPEQTFDPGDALTFERTATRAFETRYWDTIAYLAEGRYRNKNSADCSHDPVTRARFPHARRDLDQLGDYLLAYYAKLASDAGMAERVLVGELPFGWRTDFAFPWMEGWLNNQTGKAHERNIAVVIPGRNRNEAVVMGDHYDTAYMEDTYGYRSGKNDGARVAASGADDNHSATTALMLAAEIFVELSRAGKLARDIWLVHLTGEEFPSDCLGARDLASKLVEGTCRLHVGSGQTVDLSRAVVRGVFVLDMIAHNNDRRPDIFQMAPGFDRQSLWLAFQGHAATRMWEAGTKVWNLAQERRGLGRGRRSPDGDPIPAIARHLAPRGEVRFHDDPGSTLFNTDGQIFADAGIPTVLFMENYDINREGYHDTQDTMANIDLDFGAAVAAIAIETVARSAVEPLP